MARRRNDDGNDWGDDWVNEGDGDIGDGIDGDDDPDFDETAHDEADQKRFSSDIAFCPECGAEVLDDADICPKCFTWIDGATHRRPSRLRSLFRVGVVVLLVVTTIGAVWMCFLLASR